MFFVTFKIGMSEVRIVTLMDNNRDKSKIFDTYNTGGDSTNSNANSPLFGIPNEDVINRAAWYSCL